MNVNVPRIKRLVYNLAQLYRLTSDLTFEWKGLQRTFKFQQYIVITNYPTKERVG